MSLIKRYLLKNEFRAFTLAEVLITLGIIGVVAAIVLPMFTKSVEDYYLAIKFRKIYSELSQAINNLQVKNSYYIDNSDSAGANLYNELATEMKFIKVDTWANISSLPADFKYYCYKGDPNNTCSGFTIATEGSYKTAVRLDGAYLFIHPANVPGSQCIGTNVVAETSIAPAATCRVFSIDVNGDKPPNMIAKDLFQVVLLKRDNNYYIKPSGYLSGTQGCLNNRPDNPNYSWGCTWLVTQGRNLP